MARQELFGLAFKKLWQQHGSCGLSVSSMSLVALSSLFQHLKNHPSTITQKIFWRKLMACSPLCNKYNKEKEKAKENNVWQASNISAYRKYVSENICLVDVVMSSLNMMCMWYKWGKKACPSKTQYMMSKWGKRVVKRHVVCINNDICIQSILSLSLEGSS